jgi:lipoate-protein ligase A
VSTSGPHSRFVAVPRDWDNSTGRVVAIALEDDLAMLRAAEAPNAAPAFRTWSSPGHAVVVGRAVEIDCEVDLAFCDSERIPVLRRPSGGRSVLLGPGTLQYALALPGSLGPERTAITGAKRYCNGLLLAALPCGHGLAADESGDLLRGDRKVGGLALRKTRNGVLVHGTLLLTADLGLLSRTLRHPVREPAYRRGRSHAEFLDNLGPVDAAELADRVLRSLLAG